MLWPVGYLAPSVHGGRRWKLRRRVMEEDDGSFAIASMEEEVCPLEEAQQLLAMVFNSLLGEVVEVVNGGDHSEREREREREEHPQSCTTSQISR